MALSIEGFRAYLANKTWNIDSPITTSSNQIIDWYCSALDKISEQFEIDIWHLTDQIKLDEFIKLYSQSEEYEAIKNESNTSLLALKAWAEYLSQESMHTNVKCYLLTWNPDNFKEGGDAGVTKGGVTRWSCHSQQPKIGDRVYLIRLGVEPKGIVASGTVIRESFADTDWRDPNKTKRYIELLPDDTRPTPVAGMLIMSVLEQLKVKANVTFKWSAQSSGVEIPPALAALVHAAWKNQERSNMAPVNKQALVPLNQIFYGPPGTGKTYVTIEAAVKAAEPSFLWEERHNLKAHYDELVAAGRIRFVTFHQSFSYEDFVEGLSADAADGKVSYEKRAGVFKELVEDAKASKEEGAEVFDAAWQKMLDMLVASDDELTMETVRGKKFKVAFEGNKTFRVYPQESQNENPYYVASVSNVRKLYYGASKKGMYNPSYVDGMLNFLKRKCGLPEKPPSKQTKKLNFVLVIDEINRGNISRIFGELITLIEPSKRIGAKEALEVILPLTGDKFGVPDNLYIIGTMNTADRSLAGLDLALRRRFTFVEMPPKPELLDGLMVESIDIGEMLRVINQRITALLDRDHCIGHAYFMPLIENPSLTLLADIFAQNILPLLQEYFFEDWQRIRWVLADQTKPDSLAFIVKEKNMDSQQLFPGVSQFKPRECWRINSDALLQVEAYQRIYQPDSAVTEQD